jgi:RimJ/RimL family protein N-acetyltransferase
MINATCAGKGYATEALQAFISAYFARIPPASDGGTGHDVLDAFTDTANYASHRVLEKCGFVKCETLRQDHESWHFGTRDSLVWRVPRPGKTLEELRLGSTAGEDDDEKFVPPVQ